MSCGALGCGHRCAEAREEGGERSSLCPGGGYPNGSGGGEGVRGAPTFSGTAAIFFWRSVAATGESAAAC